MTIEEVYANWCHVGGHVRYEGDRLYRTIDAEGVTRRRVCSFCIVQALGRADEAVMQRRLRDLFGEEA